MPFPFQSETSASDDTQESFNLEPVYQTLGNQFDTLLANLDFSVLVACSGLDRITVYRLGLITAFQLTESLPDLLAAEAVWARQDWKSALRLPPYLPLLPTGGLCRFRRLLYSSPAARLEFQQLLDRLGKIGFYQHKKLERFSAGNVLTTVCMLTRFDHLKQAMKMALLCVGSIQPDWLRAYALPSWYARYKTGQGPQFAALTRVATQKQADRLGMDIHYLLTTLTEQHQTHLIEQPAMQRIAELLRDEFLGTGEELRWQMPVCPTCMD